LETNFDNHEKWLKIHEKNTITVMTSVITLVIPFQSSHHHHSYELGLEIPSPYRGRGFKSHPRRQNLLNSYPKLNPHTNNNHINPHNIFQFFIRVGVCFLFVCFWFLLCFSMLLLSVLIVESFYFFCESPI